MEYQISRWQRWHPCLHISSLSKNRTKILRTKKEEEIPQCRNSSRVIHTHTHTHTDTHIYISPLNRLLRKRSVPANCNSDSAGRNSRLPEILQWGDSWRKSCQAAVLMKRYRRDRVSLKISRHLAFQIRDVRGSRRGGEGRKGREEVSESAGKVFFEFG